MMRRALSFALVLAALTACNAIAGISDYREDTPTSANDSDGGGGGAADAGGAAGDDGASPNGDAGSDGAGQLPSGCVPIDVSVVASPTAAYLGVEIRDPPDLAQKIPAGETRTLCGSVGVLIDLRGDPDDTHATHRWDGTPCGIDARCRFTITGPTHVTAHLQ